MRNFAIAIACTALVACNTGAGDSAESEQAAPDAAPVMAADGALPEGRYRAVSESGVVLIEELRADGTYAFSDEAGAVFEEGTYEQRSPERLCFIASTQGAEEICYAEEIGDDGVWRTTDPNTGEVSVVERIDAE